MKIDILFTVKGKRILVETGKYIKDYADTTTLHGVRYFAYTKAHLTESLLWIIVFGLSVYGALRMISNSWQRYNANPTVIAIQKNYRGWNIAFPAATFCFTDSLDDELGANFIAKNWGIEIDGNITTNSTGADYFNETSSDITNNEMEAKKDKFNYYMQFLRDLVNTTYENLDHFYQYEDDETLMNLDTESTVLDVLMTIDQESMFFVKEFKDTKFLQIPTEMGMCYTHGGVLSDYITLRGNHSIRKDFKPPTCNLLHSSCYARTEGLPRVVRYYIHSPYEIPDISDNWFNVVGRMDRDTSFTVLETVVAPEIYRLSTSQRQCRFMTESVLPHIPVYSFNLCRMQCRKELAFQLCGCAPYFYTKESRIPVCRVKGLICLARHSEMLKTLRMSGGKKVPCDCLPQCIDNKYFKDRETVHQWSYPVPYDIRFRWAIEKSPKIRLRRDVIFSFEDLLVSLGSTAGFFMGCSVLSFVEIIYFFTIRLYWFMRKKS